MHGIVESGEAAETSQSYGPLAEAVREVMSIGGSAVLVGKRAPSPLPAALGKRNTQRAAGEQREGLQRKGNSGDASFRSAVRRPASGQTLSLAGASAAGGEENGTSPLPRERGGSRRRASRRR